jgi:multiple sugar transport system permease protein
MRKYDKQTGKKTATALCFILPFFLIYSIFVIWPVIQGFFVSLHRWSLMGMGEFRGLRNFARFLRDGIFWSSLWHTTLYVLINVPSALLASLVCALLANRKTPLQKYFRVCYYLPNVLSVTVISYMARLMASPYLGFVSTLLHSLGILPPGKEIQWLMEPPLIWIVVNSISVWWALGFSMMLFISALQDIPGQIYEAAEIDGAGKARQLFSITLPLLAPTFYLVLMLKLIASFKIFGQVFLISGGGPGRTTLPLIQYIYETAFSMNDMGYASAMSYALFIILVSLTFLQLKIQNRGEKYE